MVETPIVIKTFPLKDNPLKGVSVILFILILSVLVFLLTQSLVFTFCAALFLIFDLKSFFFPTRFIIYEDKVEKKFLYREKSFPISKFKTVINCKRGILLSPYKERLTLLEKFRGLYIICFDASQKEMLLNFFREKIEQ